MSRVGKKPIPLPKGVKITVGEQFLTSKGPRASRPFRFRRASRIRQKDGILELQRDGDDKAALHGLTRALAANAVQGVSTGFTRELDIVGIGYRCDVKGRIATFTLGYSHSDRVLSAGRHRHEDRQADAHLVLTGADRQLLGQVARTCARCVRRIRTRTRACAIRAKCCARRSARPAPSRRQIMARDSKNQIRLRIHTRIRRRVKGTRGASAPGGVPQREAYLRAGDRRYAGPHRGRGLVERKERRPTAAILPAPRASASWWPSGPRTKASRPWCSIAAGIFITAA